SVEILSLREELAQVTRLGVTILLATWLYLAAVLGDVSAVKRSLLPYQSLIGSRPSVEQRTFRELQEGLLEAERMRSTSGSWPAAEALANDGIPLFAPDPTARSHYRWQLMRDGTFINYLGIPQA